MSETNHDIDVQVALALGWYQWDGMHDWDGPDNVTFFFADKQWDRLSVYEPGSDDINRFVSFSTKIADAWSLVERMEKTHHARLKTPFFPGEPYFCGVTPHGVTGWNGRPDVYEPGETMPLAICRCFLELARAPQGEEREK